MPESKSHKTAKRREAGKTGKTEVKVGRGRLDAATPTRAVEIERSGNPDRLVRSAKKLKSSGRPTRVLVVPHKDLAKGRDAMRRAGTTGTVKNLTGTQSTHVGVRKSNARVNRRQSGKKK